MPSDTTYFNGTQYSWYSCEFAFDGQAVEGILSTDYEQKRTRKVVFAARRDGTPLGKTAGKYEVPTLTVKMLRETAQWLKTYLTTQGSGSFGDAVFSYTVSVYEPDKTIVPITVNFQTCTFEGEKASHAEGIDELVSEVTIGSLALTENDMQLWSAIRGQT